MILAVCGLMGSGKDTVAKRIAERYGCRIIDYANKLREICRHDGMEVTRDNLQNLRLKYGNTFLAEAVVEEIKASKSENFVLVPIRRSEDFSIVKKEFPEAVLIRVDAPDDVRFARLRARRRENDPQSMEEFRRQEKREYEIFNFSDTFAMADFTVDNTGTAEDLYEKIDKIMKVVA